MPPEHEPTPVFERLAGKRALVTGAASGIGRATAVRFAAEGASVALVDVNVEALVDAAEAIGRNGGTAARFTADVSDEEQIRRAVGGAVEAFGGLDVVVANAGVNFPDRAARVHELELDVWIRTMHVNAAGVFLTCKHAIPALLRSGGGSVICTGSPTGLRGMSPEHSAYSASKAAVMALARVMAVEYAQDGIRVNSVLPGFTETPFVQRLRDDPARRRIVEQQIPLGRAATPDEIASMMVFLASDESAYATGALFIVDGGRTAV